MTNLTFAAEIAVELSKITHGGVQVFCSALARAIVLMSRKSLMSEGEKWKDYFLGKTDPQDRNETIKNDQRGLQI